MFLYLLTRFGAGIMSYGGSIQMGVSVMKTFNSLDQDKNNLLSAEEIKEWVEALDIDFASLDADSSGEISEPEFKGSVFPMAEDENSSVTVEGNRALGTLDSVQWHFDMLGEKQVNMSGHGGGILLLSISSSRSKSSLVMLSGSYVVKNVAGVGGGIAHANALEPGQTAAQTPVTGHMLAAGDVVIAGNTAVMNENSFNMKSLVQEFMIEGGDERVPWGDGGGLWSLDFKATLLSGVSFRDNHAHYGGGICLKRSSTVLISRAIFSGNTAESNGGALSAFQGSTITAEGSHFAQNSAGVYGGAIASEVDSSAMLRLCTLQSNSAQNGGGLVSLEGSRMTIERCRALDNTAEVDGGGKQNGKAPDVGIVMTYDIDMSKMQVHWLQGNRPSTSGLP